MNSHTRKKHCFHCGLPVAPGLNIFVDIAGQKQPMCCYGCQAVAQTIVNTGMEDFYRFRTATPATPEDIVPAFLNQLKAYDNPVIQRHFTTDPDSSPTRQTSLILEGIVCAACIWLNEKHISALPGVINVNINYTNHRAQIEWDNSQVSLSQILEAISRIGYRAYPYNPGLRQHLLEKEKKQHIKRIGIAGILGMQIMILAVALYTGEWWGMDAAYMQYFRWISLLITLPLLLFSSRPFFSAALRDLQNHRVGMDVPVSLGISIAFCASVVNTVNNNGNVYYDSIAMFTFLLLTARFFEMGARKKTAESTEALLNLQPTIATKLTNDNDNQVHQISVAVAELEINDIVLVRPGENIPTDGIIVEGASSINESLITGESLPIDKKPGDPVIGGSTNTESPLKVRVDKIGEDTVLASIHKLVDSAQNSKPAIALLADRVASRFVAVILFIATMVAIYWYHTDPQQWIEITIATLVVSCPCALSLATPAAITAASGSLAKIGLLPTNSRAMETYAKVTDFVFDKTGTLTTGDIKLTRTVALGPETVSHYLQIAAALESESEHPIARSLIQSAGEDKLTARNITNKPGKGISGTVNSEKWYIGNLKYINAVTGAPLSQNPRLNDETNSLLQEGKTIVALATDKQWHAIFILDDEIKQHVDKLVLNLKNENKTITLMTGDHEAPALRIAKQAGITNIYSEMTPADKLKAVQAMQKKGSIVAMTGDGINDAPVLAGADVSIAMGSGTQIAAAHADMILLSNHIEYLHTGYRLATKTLGIIRQNLGWAIGYNVVAIPAAAAGYVEPWLAALGMSASSLIVVLNALRLTRSSN